MDLETYATMFRSRLEQELRDKGMEYVVERAGQAEGALGLEEYLGRRAGAASCSAPDPIEGWADCSEHVCAICGETAWSNLRFHWHVKRQHGIGGTKEYRRLHGNPERLLRQHECQVCGSKIKWEASRIRDHLKFHREDKDKLTIKEYGEKFREYILAEVTKVKGAKTSEVESRDAPKDDTEAEAGEPAGYNVDEWKALFRKKVTPKDRVECDICRKTMNRHSFTRHQEKAHQGILNVRDLNRLKKKQASLASSGVVKSLGELVAGAGGVRVRRGRGPARQEVEVGHLESRLHLYRAGLTLDQIERKGGLLQEGLTITRAGREVEEEEAVEREEDEMVEMVEMVEIEETSGGELTNYPTYIVDEDTGEILFVEEVASEQAVAGQEIASE